MRVTVFYPSGRKATFVGSWRGPIWIDDELSVAIDLTEDGQVGKTRIQIGSAVLLDPRAVVRNVANSDLLYQPRRQDVLPNWVNEWLNEHPEWPGELDP